jgi:hypothetical protein
LDGCQKIRWTFGLVDELRLYKRGLSRAEVKKNMDAEELAVQPDQMLALTWGKIKMAKYDVIFQSIVKG